MVRPLHTQGPDAFATASVPDPGRSIARFVDKFEDEPLPWPLFGCLSAHHSFQSVRIVACQQESTDDRYVWYCHPPHTKRCKNLVRGAS